MNLCLNLFNKSPLIEVDDSDRLQTEAIPSYSPENLPLIEQAKLTGNNHVRSGSYKKAIQEYTKGIGLFSVGNDSIQAPNQAATILLTNLYSNRATAYTKIGEYQNALYDSRAVIIYRPDWVKGHYRLGDAYFGLRCYEKALEAYSKASSIVL
jgi:tetratricopeptide (TPR) repeat protein